MKRYDVLDAHLGDKSYAAGGTRIADPAAVAHLVELGILREADDQTDLDVTVPANNAATDLQRQVEALTQERDAARAELATLRDLQHGSEGDVAALRGQVEALTQELAGKAAPATPAAKKATN